MILVIILSLNEVIEKVGEEVSKNLMLSDIIDIIEETLQSGKTFKFMPSGVSMLPLLRHNKDFVILKQKKDKHKKYDIILYRRVSEEYILHRIIKVKKDSYVLCGDNQTALEKNIKHEQIIGYVSSYIKNGKEYNMKNFCYKMYSIIRVKTIFIRRIFRHFFRKVNNR